MIIEIMVTVNGLLAEAELAFQDLLLRSDAPTLPHDLRANAASRARWGMNRWLP